MHTPTVLRWGFSPHSLSTDYALTSLAFCGITDTLCDDIKFYVLILYLFFAKVNQQNKQKHIKNKPKIKSSLLSLKYISTPYNM